MGRKEYRAEITGLLAYSDKFKMGLLLRIVIVKADHLQFSVSD
jgi:hypothetical protein